MRWTDKPAWQFVGVVVSVISLIVSLYQENRIVLFLSFTFLFLALTLPLMPDLSFSDIKIWRGKPDKIKELSRRQKASWVLLLEDLLTCIKEDENYSGIKDNLQALADAAKQLGYLDVAEHCINQIEGKWGNVKNFPRYGFTYFVDLEEEVNTDGMSWLEFLKEYDPDKKRRRLIGHSYSIESILLNYKRLPKDGRENVNYHTYLVKGQGVR